MIQRRGPDPRRIPRHRRLGLVLFANAALAAALGACAKTAELDIPPGPLVDGQTPAGDPACGPGAVACGESGAGCCASGFACAAGGCVPASCTTSAECSGDAACGGGECRPWSNYPAGLARNFDCRNGVDLPSLKPTVQCRWPGNTPPADFPNSVQVISTPMVVDFNYDDDPTTHDPSIVFVSYEDLSERNGVLRVINGKTCALEASISGESNPFLPEVSPALGDIDGDGRPDIVAVDLSGGGFGQRTGVAVYGTRPGAPNFRLLARQNSSLTADIKGLSIHDVADDNDVPEVLTDTGIYAFREGTGIPEKDNNEGSALEPPIVRDVDGDSMPELVTAVGIKNWSSDAQDVVDKLLRNQPLWNEDQAVPEAAFVGMANLGDFPSALGQDAPEMIIVSPGQLMVTRVDGRVLLRVSGGRGVAAGPPVVADLDGDGRMEFASPGVDTLTAYDLDCSDDDGLAPVASNCKNPDGDNPQAILWQVPARGAQSGASVFDFDGDGRTEVVYADQCYLRILDGQRGTVLFSVPRSSTTRWDYPVIADVDGDTHTEIVTASNDHDAAALGCPSTDPLNPETAFEATHGVTVWSDPPPKRWAGSRMIWNQHTYSVTNVHDDGTIPEMGTIPSQFRSRELDPNTLRQNVQGTTGVSLQLADVTTWVNPVPTCQGNRSVAQIEVSMCNRGLRDLPASSVNLSMLRTGAPNALCSKGNTRALPSGTCETITCDLQVPDSAPGFDILVVGDSTDAVAECIEGANNTTQIKNVFCVGVVQ